MVETGAPKDGNRRGVEENGQPHIASGRRSDAALGQSRPGRWGALVLAIYITLLLIVAVAIAQVLYFRVVIAREDRAGEETPDLPDMNWLREPAETQVGFAADEAEPERLGDSVLVGA
jgi:hypothetical protein